MHELHVPPETALGGEHGAALGALRLAPVQLHVVGEALPEGVGFLAQQTVVLAVSSSLHWEWRQSRLT